MWDEEVFVFPASYAQQRLWFLDQFDPGSPFYNIPNAVKIHGKLDAVVLNHSINEIIRRHEALRTTFTVLEGNPVQVIHPRLTIDIPVIELNQANYEGERDAAARALINEEACKPFDLSKGPLLRVTLIHLSDLEHILMLTMHHIVSDGWSMGVLIYELSTLYRAFSSGKNSPLPDLPIQYADYSEWQRNWLQGEVLEKQISYWKNKLGDIPPVLEIPGDRPRPAVLTSRGDAYYTIYPKRILDRLKEFGQEHGATLFMTLLAGFKALLFRYTGQVDITIGSPIANRQQVELESLIGIFINTVVFRTNLSNDPTFHDLLLNVREVTMEAYAHQDVPFEVVVDHLNLERDMSHTPLFQVMFILQNAPIQAGQLDGVMGEQFTIEEIDVHAGTSTFDLTLSIAEAHDGISISIEYNTDIFDFSTIQRLSSHYRKILESALAHPDMPISVLRILDDDELQQILIGWNQTYSDFMSSRWSGIDRRQLCVHHLFELQAQVMPDAVAVISPADGIHPRRQLTYRELNHRATQLASYLRQSGAGPEIVVGVCMERSLEMIVSLIGILKSGAAYLPFDPAAPTERLAFILSDARHLMIPRQGDDNSRPIILTQAKLVNRFAEKASPGDSIDDSFAGINVNIIKVDTDWDEIAALSAQVDLSSHIQVSPRNLVYITYTSGSTGQSKGVLVEHGSLVNAYLAWEEAYDLQAGIAHLQMANYTFDVFSGDLVRALCSGGKLVLCPREWLLSGDRLYRLMKDENIDTAEFVPAVLRNLVQYLDNVGERLDFVRLLACGSDSWYVGEYRKFRLYLGSDTRLINSFGLTEATIDSTYYEGTTEHLSPEQLVPIGRPFPNTRLYILDDHLQPSPVGVPGELFVGGPGVARGYNNRPGLNSEKFIQNPFDSDSDSFYRTGDVARYLPDGNVEFLGRLDDQLKIRGLRIEPGEIESILGSHPSVKEAAVSAVEVSVDDKRLVGYLVWVDSPNQENKPTTGDLRRYLQERLPDYMVPSAFVVLDSLPLNASGKVDRRLLSEQHRPDWSERNLTLEFVAPRTPIEETLADIWTQVLGTQQIGVYDNFFELGGHSLLATQLVSRIREVFQLDLPLRNLFESPTIATLAEQIDALASLRDLVQPMPGGHAGDNAIIPPLRPIERDPITGLPVNLVLLSFAQQRLWFLDQLEPDSPFYNIPEVVRIKGKLERRILENCLLDVVARHESLRTAFQLSGDIPVQVVTAFSDSGSTYLQNIDLTNLPEGERENEALRIAQEEAQQPFDLSTGPLLRVKLVRIAEEDHLILLTMHHIIGDNWSSNVLISEIAILYDAKINERPSPLIPLGIQYTDFSTWQRNWLQGEMLQEQIDYWKRDLSGLPAVLELPADRPRPSMQTFNGNFCAFSLPPGLSEDVRQLCRDQGVTLFMALLATFQTLIFRYSGQEDFAVGSPIANRTIPEVENLIGFFVNTLVLRSNLSEEPNFITLLQRVRETALGAYAHQDVPFEMVVDALQPERNLSHSPLFQVMFTLQTSPRSAITLPQSRLQIAPLDVHSGTSKFDLTLFMVDEGDYLSGAWEYNTDLFDAVTIDRMVKHFEMLLSEIVQNPEKPVTQLSMLTDLERQLILVEWNRTSAVYPEDLCVHQLFEEQVCNTPDAIALVYPRIKDGLAVEELWSYRQLNQRSNQLAHYLLKLGVRPETLVGVYLERSPEMVIGLLGVMKAGGAYVPLDPSYPSERIRYMIEDSGVAIVVTQHSLLTRLSEQISQPGSVVDVNRLSHSVIAIDDGLGSGIDPFVQESEENPACEVRPENVVYVIYTSGSTGRPKGVMILHRGLMNYLTWCSKSYPVAEGAGSPVHSSISFDLTVTSLFTPLITGKTAHLLPEGLGVGVLGEALRDWADHDKGPFSLVKITPAHLQLLSEQLTGEQAKDRTQAFIIGGENLTLDHIRFWQENAPQTLLVNEYGPTETVVGCCVYWVPKDEIDPSINNSYIKGVLPIGRPIINTQLYILDAYQQPVPVGLSGELYIGGVGVGRGYLNRPDITEEKFVPDLFSATPGARLYRTGDRAYYLPDGNIICLGRIDFQVKIRGFRIELGEIETVINQYPGIKESVVWIWQPGEGQKLNADQRLNGKQSENKNLVAYVVLQPDMVVQSVDGSTGEFSATEFINGLKSHLQSFLPEYMIPVAYVILDALPLTSNGKIDRKVLPDPDLAVFSRSGTSDGLSFVSPRTPQEEIIAGIWAQILHIDQVGVFENFFDLGGHSLLATQVISRIRDSLQVDLPLRSLFESPNIAGLAAQVEVTRLQATGLMPPPITRLPRTPETGIPVDMAPLSFSQQRLWVLDQLIPDSPLYNIPMIVRIAGALNLDALRYSLRQIVYRHEVLRTVFSQVDGKPYQKVLPAHLIDNTENVKIIDLRSIPDAVRQTTAEQLAQHEVLVPFDLENGPLLRLVVIQLGDADAMIVLTTHHIVTDDWSLGIFINELFFYYSNEPQVTQDHSGPHEFLDIDEYATLLPELAIQYVDYSAWQRQWLQGNILDDQMEYWRNQLAGIPELLELPVDHPRPAAQTFRGSQVTFELSSELSAEVHKLSRQEGATLFMTLLAVFDVLLYRYTGMDDIAIGTPIANRTRSEVESLIGFFVNTLVIRADMSGEPSFRQMIRRIRESAIGAYAHQDIPFEMLVDALNPSRDMSYHPLFQVMFILQNAPREIQIPMSDLQIEPVDLHEGIARFDLTLTLVETPVEGGSVISGSFEYNSDLFERSTIERMIGHFITLIQGVTENPESHIDRLQFLAPEERNLILGKWAGHDGEYPRERCVHELFEEQAQKNPDACALIFANPGDVQGSRYPGKSQLSYSDLNDRANHLARRLRARGVKPDSLVGICLERSLEMVISVLGVLKAGGAFVPLDPNYPHERLDYMLKDADVKVLITQQKLLDQLSTFAGEFELLILDDGVNAMEEVDLIEPDSSLPEQIDLKSQATPDTLAYVIYTSGSTGQPKGVLVEHGGLTNLVHQQIHGFGVDAHSRVLQFASFSFDACASEIFMALVSGGQLVITSQDTLKSVMDLLQLMDEQGVTVVTFPPSLLRVLDAELVRQALPGLTTLISAGEACPEDVGKRWAVGRKVFNAYGPTEATIGPTYYEITIGTKENGELYLEGFPEGRKTVPIGKPIENMRVYILDRNCQPVPAGVAGEIYLSGVGLARGYLHQEELTAEKFIDNPYHILSSAPQEVNNKLARMYRTGDLGRYLPDGNIEYLGRADMQVKLRGYRIELGEIEANLTQNSNVKASIVLAREDHFGNKQLVAYIVPETGVAEEDISAEHLKDYLRQRLPEYMVPVLYVFIDQFPLTPNGKIDRKALPAPEEIEFQLTTAYLPPRTEEEVALAGIWSEVIAFKPTETHPTIGINDNFFELGGDSILAIQVIARANQAGLHLTPRHLFEYPTIAELVNLVLTLEEFVESEAGAMVMERGESPTEPPQTGELSADLEDFGWSEDDLHNILGVIAKNAPDDEPTKNK